MADVEIDLYDTIEDDFPQETEAAPAATNGNDLYDDVITSKPVEKAHEPKSPITAPSPTTTTTSTTAGGYPPRKHSIYVSNLTWWTNDEDVLGACKAVGVGDVLEVKFYENRANGQSRGFATVSTASEETKQKLFEQLRSQSIHGQQLRTHYWTKSNLAMLDTASGGTRFTGDNEMQQPQGPRFMPPQRPPMGMGPRPQFGPGGPMRTGGPMMGPRPGMMPGGPMPGMAGMGMVNGQTGPMAPRPPMQQSGMMPPMQRPGMPPMQQQAQMMPQNRPPMQQGFPNSQQFQQPGMQQQPGMMTGQMPMQQQQQQQQMPPMSQAQPAPHVNPAFFPGGQAPQMAMQQQTPTPQQPVMVDQYGRPVDGNQQQPSHQVKSEPVGSSNQLSDVEFQEILTRNKSVSSSAISRAVQDASQGDFASAIETLVTAISLIKQSKIASDDRCKILIASLQDTKQGIEDKSYGGGGSRRRSRSREREYSAPSRKRERSRSRERDTRRDYRERSREKDSRSYYQDSRTRDRYH